MANELTTAQTFQIEEYKALRKEIELALQSVYTQEQYAFAGAGLTWGWLVTHHTANLFLWCLPVLIMIVLYFRVGNMMTQVFAMGGHIRTIEASFGWNGWEHRFAPTPEYKGPTRLSKVAAHIDDYLLELGGLVAAVLAATFRVYLLK